MILKDLFEPFITNANKHNMFENNLPLVPQRRDNPVIPVEKWRKTDKGLTKTFLFYKNEDKKRFIIELLDYEEETNHNAKIIISENEVFIRIITKNIEKVTNIDEEYSKFVDVLYKDILNK